MGSPLWTFALLAFLGSLVVGQLGPGARDLNSTSYTGNTLRFFGLELLAWFLWRVFVYPKFFSPLRHLPRPRGKTYFTDQWDRMLLEPTGVILQEWLRDIPNEGLICFHDLFNVERVVPTSPKALAELLSTKAYDFEKPPNIRSLLGNIQGFGLLVAEGENHKFQRKHLMPAFAYRHIKTLYPIFWTKTQELTNAFTKETEKAPAANPKADESPAIIDAADWAKRVTLDVVGLAAFGSDFNSIKDPKSEFNTQYHKVFAPNFRAIILTFLNVFLPPSIAQILPIKKLGGFEGAKRYINENFRSIIRKRKEKLDQGSEADLDVLSVAMRSGAFSEDDLINQMMTFLAAGHETTASTLTWAVYLLCTYPDVQQELRREIRANLPSVDTDEPFAAVTIDRLPYLQAFCNECLRFYSPIPLTPREAIRDTTLLGQPIPKGTSVLIGMWAINRSEELWGPDASEFKPARWLNSEKSITGSAQSHYAFLTFLHGSRSCIGQNFARAEVATLIAGLVGKFKMEMADPKEKVELRINIIARPARALRVRMRVMDGW